MSSKGKCRKQLKGNTFSDFENYIATLSRVQHLFIIKLFLSVLKLMCLFENSLAFSYFTNYYSSFIFLPSFPLFVIAHFIMYLICLSLLLHCHCYCSIKLNLKKLKGNTSACAVARVLLDVNGDLWLLYKLQSCHIFGSSSIFLWHFNPMHRGDDVRSPISKCWQVTTTGQLCGGLSGMCGVPAFGHTKKRFSASRNRCKVSRYSLYSSLNATYINV